MSDDRRMRRVYKKASVYDAAIERLEFIFENFERIYLSFSGGKDSGALLNLILKFMKERSIKRKIGIQILDNEANYEYSCEFMRRILEANREYLDIYWCCMPISLPCTVSSYQVDWQCWGVGDEERWVRPLPTQDYVVNIHNHPFGDKFIENMNYDDFWDMFAEWYSQGNRTLVKSACDVKFPKGAATIIIPRRAIDEILKTTGDNGGEFSWSDKILQVKSGEWVYATKLIDAQFPDYAKFIPKANGHFIKVASEELRGAIYRLQAIETNRSFVKLGWEDGAKELSAHLNGNGEGGEFIECETADMAAGEVLVSSAALMDIATALDSKSMTFHITAHNQPFRVSADDRPNAVVMQAPIVGPK